MKLPDEFISNIRGAFGTKGEQFITDLPELISHASRSWSLVDIQSVSNLSFNFVAFAKRGSEDVVLKIGVLNEELISEMAALRLFDGNGLCHLLECDEARGIFLLERLEPGMMLSELEDDEQSTQIAAQVMSNLWRPAPDDPVFIKLSDWFDGFKTLRTQFNNGTGPFDG